MTAARIPPLDPPFAATVEQALSAMHPGRNGGEPLRLFRTLARDLPLAGAMTPLGRFMLSPTGPGGPSFDARTRELVIDRVTARCGCEYEWGVHVTAFGRKVGLTPEQIASLAAGGPDDACWSEEDRAVLRMVDELHDAGQVSDATWARLAARFDERALLELLLLAGWYHAIAFVANGARVAREAWGARFPAVGG